MKYLSTVSAQTENEERRIYRSFQLPSLFQRFKTAIYEIGPSTSQTISFGPTDHARLNVKESTRLIERAPRTAFLQKKNRSLSYAVWYAAGVVCEEALPIECRLRNAFAVNVTYAIQTTSFDAPSRSRGERGRFNEREW